MTSAALGEEVQREAAAVEPSASSHEETEAERERKLMNGPQAVEEAPSQQDIDALFEQVG